MSEAHAPAQGAHGHSAQVAHQFEDAGQQHETSTVGMWLFLGQEVMFFGAVFAAYMVYRSLYYPQFVEGSLNLSKLFGTINTAVLLTSSLTMALAVHAAQSSNRAAQVRYLLITIALAFVFLGIKAVEYTTDYREGLIPILNWSNEEVLKGSNPGQVQLFFWFYFIMTGLHALHIIGGIVLLSVIAWYAHRGRYNAGYATPVELSGLYWHFVDLVWVFLFPLLYLIGRAAKL